MMNMVIMIIPNIIIRIEIMMNIVIHPNYHGHHDLAQDQIYAEYGHQDHQDPNQEENHDYYDHVVHYVLLYVVHYQLYYTL